MKESKIAHLKQFFSAHFEWIALLTGLLAMGLMNPYIDNGPSFCMLEMMNFPFCPGEGLGHSIAYVFRGDLTNAMEANVLGPVSIIILLSRVIYLFNDRANFNR